MERYFFDIQSGREYFADQEGLRLPSQKAAEVEAMKTLTGMVSGSVFTSAQPDMAVEVRSGAERLFCVSIIRHGEGTRH
jgi:hypothetical protein